VFVATPLSMSFRDAQAQAAACTLAFGPAGVVRVGEKISVQANCPGIDPAKTEFMWKVEYIDDVGNRKTIYQSKGTIGRSMVKFNFKDPSLYEVTLRYSTDGKTWNAAPKLPMPVAPAAPPAAAAKPPAPGAPAAALKVSLRGHKTVQQNSREVVYIIPNNGVPPYHVTLSGARSGSLDFKIKAWFLAPADTPGDKTITITVKDAKGATFSRTVTFNVVGTAAPAPIGVNSYVGSYIATITGSKPPDTNKYWAHVVGQEPQGYVISVYAFGTNLHFVLNPNTGKFTMESANGTNIDGTGSIAGSGAVGTTITMSFTATASDGTTRPYIWKLTKYDNHDFAGPQAKAPDGTAFAR
jgi:hypothetical protein